MSKTTNVQVAVRCRPLSARESKDGHTNVVECDGATTTINATSGAAAARGPRTFTYDYSYGPEVDQRTVYSELALPLVAKALNGYNGTVFAYGQTGSGKTYTMMGDETTPGIIPQLNRDVFASIEAQAADNKKFLVMVSYLEIYNEVIKDLLNPSEKRLRIREHPSTGIFVEDLAELVVHNEEEVQRFLEQGNKVRKVAATDMNQRSSRSHSCFTIRVEQKILERDGDVERETNLFAKLNLVDLAGSERASKTGATGARLREGAAINKSLSALANVINALAEGGKKHTPYRDSKLTRLLQQSLGGNSVTCMVATISPASYNADETLSTLQYANRAKSIKNKTHRNENQQERIIRQLREEIDKLRAELAAAREGGAAAVDMPSSEADKKKMAEMEAALQRAQQSWQEKEKQSRQIEEERASVIGNTSLIRSLMQTMKEENLEVMKRVKTLQAEKSQLARLYKRQRAQFNEARDKLAADTKRYGELAQSGDRNKRKLQELLDRVSRHKRELVDVREAMAATKASIKENEQRQQLERAEAAMQRKLLVEDAELRQLIREDEMAKMEVEKKVFLKQALEEERARLRAETEKERAALMAKYAESTDAAGEREQGLELALLQANHDKHMLRLDMEEVRRQYEWEVANKQREFVKAQREEKLRTLAKFREFCEGFEADRAVRQEKLTHVTECLRQAVQDIVFLKARNEELEKQAHDLARWEPAA